MDFDDSDLKLNDIDGNNVNNVNNVNDDQFDIISHEIHHTKVESIQLKYLILTDEGPLVIYNDDFTITSSITDILHSIFNIMKEELKNGSIRSAPVCGPNSTNLCVRFGGETLHDHTLDTEEIFIVEWRKDWKQVEIPPILGDNKVVIGASYHALVHLICSNGDKTYYIACDSVFDSPYLFQYYITDTEEQLFAIIMKRYLATGVFLYACWGEKSLRRPYTYRYKIKESD